MEEKPSKTLNLIDKLMHAAESPSTASSSRTSTAEDHQQLCDSATALTLHQSWLQPASTTNKRKAKAPVIPEEENRIEKPAAPTKVKHQKLVLSDHENMELKKKRDPVVECDDAQNLHTLTEGSARPSARHHIDEQVARDPALYKIKKKLTLSDLGNLSRLLVPKEMVKKHVLPLVDADFVQRLESKAGKQVTVKDSDKEAEHQLTFRYLRSSKSYVFNGNWMEIVKGRDLKKDDEIGLYWDTLNSKFHFSLLKVASQESQLSYR
ncbi:putative B3 domain-containing protein [Rosa sericea]